MVKTGQKCIEGGVRGARRGSSSQLHGEEETRNCLQLLFSAYYTEQTSLNVHGNTILGGRVVGLLFT